MFITVIQNKYPHFEIQLPLQWLGTDEVCLASELLLLAYTYSVLKATHAYIYFVQMKNRRCQLHYWT